MTAIFKADNVNNWLEIYSENFEANYRSGKQIPIYNPIPKTLLPIFIDSALIAIHCVSSQYPTQRKYLGRVIQAINTQNIFPTNTASNKSVSLYSNETILAEFINFDDSYQLLLDLKWWIEDITITIYKYIGEGSGNLNTRLTEIEKKIDQLL